MVDELVKRCDVYGTIRDVRQYEITVRQLEPGEKPAMEPRPGESKTTLRVADLGDRGYRRLLKFVDRGLVPPTTRTKKESETE